MHQIVLNDLRKHRVSIIRTTHDRNLAEALLAMAQRVILATAQDERWQVTLEAGGEPSD
jgi:hypothetical protein